jgi:5-methyltetrahydrofolate--homocysteine methyltransferase
VDAAMKNARTAVEHCGRGYVALDLGPTGRLLKPMGDLDFEEAVSIYTEVVKAGVRGGADLILIETRMNSRQRFWRQRKIPIFQSLQPQFSMEKANF